MIVCGDFNLPNVTWETYSANDAETDVFLSQRAANEFHRLLREPTHRKGNILDLVLANYENVHMKPPLLSNFSDNLAVQFLREVFSVPQKNIRQINELYLPFQSYLPLAEITEQNIFFELDDEYIDYWLTKFDNLLSPWMKNKRKNICCILPTIHRTRCIYSTVLKLNEDRKPRQ